MRGFIVSVLTLIAITAIGAAANQSIGNLGYNSYEGYVSGGVGLHKYFGPGVGYPGGFDGPAGNPYGVGGDYMRKYVPADQWGKMGYGTGHLGEGWGPYIYSNRDGASPPGLFDPLPGAYMDAPAPAIKIDNGHIYVSMQNDIPGIKCVTVTILAFNEAELACQTIDRPPYKFCFPVMDGVKNVRVRIDYCDSGLSATSYPL